jgi:hypothetical protein
MTEDPRRQEDLNTFDSTSKNSEKIDRNAAVGRVDGDLIERIFNEGLVFDRSLPPSRNVSKPVRSVLSINELPFNPEWITASFVAIIEINSPVLRKCLADLEQPGFLDIENELSKTVVPSIWESDFPEKISVAMQQNASRDEAIISCFAVARNLSTVSEHSRNGQLLEQRAGTSSIAKPIQKGNCLLENACSILTALLVDRGVSCQVLARCLGWNRAAAALHEMLLGLPGAPFPIERQSLIMQASEDLDSLAALIAAPPFVAN